ncbi:MAG: CPBP family intramembrane metalloprotease, partial [Chloroflexi bacterium]|nr:CPBP family intramembrane metalloprotease [Chloroflexota bacterium]
MSEPPPAPDGAGGDGQGAAAPAVLGLFRFTMEGRQAPGLFVAGWLAALVGGSAAFVGLLSGATLAGALLFVGGLAVVLVGLVLLGGSQAVERRHAGLAYAGPSPIVTFLAVVAGWYLATVVVATPLQLAGVVLEGPSLALLAVVIQGLVVVGILRLMVVGSEALSWGEMGVRRPDGTVLRDLAWGALFAAPVILVTGLTLQLLVQVVHQEPAAPLPPSGTASGLVLNLLSGALIAPLYEELFFRGFTLTAWRRTRGARSAILRSAILFALIHTIDQSGETFGAALGVAFV